VALLARTKPDFSDLGYFSGHVLQNEVGDPHFLGLSAKVVILKKICSCLSMRQRLLFYNSMIRSVLDYVSSIWTSCDKENLGCVLKLQTSVASFL